MRLIRIVFPLLVTFALFADLGCMSIRPQVVSQKTQLERQILGEFEQLEKDLVMVSSVRSKGAPDAELSPAHREALMAVMNRQFRRDDIEEYKRSKNAGEGLDGLVRFFPTSETRTDGALEKRIRKTLDEENRDREIIMRRVIDMHEGLDDGDLKDVQAMMGELNQADCLPGDLIQDEEEGWIPKPLPQP